MKSSFNSCSPAVASETFPVYNVNLRQKETFSSFLNLSSGEPGGRIKQEFLLRLQVARFLCQSRFSFSEASGNSSARQIAMTTEITGLGTAIRRPEATRTRRGGQDAAGIGSHRAGSAQIERRFHLWKVPNCQRTNKCSVFFPPSRKTEFLSQLITWKHYEREKAISGRQNVL